MKFLILVGTCSSKVKFDAYVKTGWWKPNKYLGATWTRKEAESLCQAFKKAVEGR